MIGLIVLACLTGCGGVAWMIVKLLQSRPVHGSSREISAEPGISYFQERIPEEPWSIHVIKVERSRHDLDFYAPLAGGRVLGLATLSAQARSIPRALGIPVGGVNGDFYERDDSHRAGDPRGLHIVDGEIVSGTSTVCVWFDATGQPHLDDAKVVISVSWNGGSFLSVGLNEERGPREAVLYSPTYGPGTRTGDGIELTLEPADSTSGAWLPLRMGKTYQARVRAVAHGGNTRIPNDNMILSLGPALRGTVPPAEPGLRMELSLSSTPDLSGARTAIAGGPAVVRNGQPFALAAPPRGSSMAYSERSKYERHPRSAVGWNDTHFYFVTVDGRQPGLSMGMTLAELGAYCVRLGCTQAMNLDGGVSASMWMSGRIVNDPCQGERPVANSLFVLRKPAGLDR